jgi:peptide/nickel transport system permease protein
MKRFIVRRLLTMIPTIFVVSVIAYSILALLPGDPALAILGEAQAKDRVAYDALRLELGLDRPIPVRYVDWATKALRGDLGTSTRTNEPVLQGILQRLPATILLSVLAMALALAIAFPLGIVSAVRPNSKTDVVGTILAMSGVALPNFWLGIVLVFVFAVLLRWLPASGYVPPQDNLGASLRLMILPVFTLGTGLAAVITRQVRSSLLEVLESDYIRTARAKGLRPQLVVQRHALKNALIPVVTVIGLQTGRLFGGTVVVESIFAIPGVGRLAVDSIYFRDFPMVQGIVLVLALAVLLTNLLTDVLYAYIDPRIKYA